MILAFFSYLPGQQATPKADLAIVNGRIWTANPAQPWAEALAISGHSIIAVGSDQDIKNRIDKNTRVINAQNRLVTPGFIDSHLHFLDSGFHLASVQLRDARTPQEFTERIAAYARTVAPGTWITGGDWDHTNWGGELPRAEWIDALTPEHPVWVSRLDGHMALANHLAMTAAGISKATLDVDGGTIVRSANGEPSGILKENAMYLIDRLVPEPPDSLKARALSAAMRHVAKVGITSVQHKGSWDDLHVFEQVHQTGTLRTRIAAAVPLNTWQRLRDHIAANGTGDRWLRVGALKAFADGSLGSHTAAFMAGFTDAPNDSGLLVNDPEELYQMVDEADKANLQVNIHAIGDRGNRMVLDLYERVFLKNGARDRRFRIEHAQHLLPTDIPRFHGLGIIASMQPYHCIDDGRWAEKVIGWERCRTTYAFRSLLESGARLAFGSDWYVAPPDPLVGIYAAVTRRTLDELHPDGWVPEQKITVEQALRAYTSDAAYASFEENIKGTLAPGMLADLVILDRDLFRIPSAEIRNVRVMMTIIDGEMIFEQK